MEKKDHKIVCVLGNGFDIDLGLPTKYTDYMNSPYFQDYLVDNNYGTPENPGVSLFKHFNNIHTEQRWIDIEKELSIMSLDKSKLRASKYNDLLSDSIVEKYEEGFKLLHETLTKYLKNLNYFKIDRSSYAAQFLEIITDKIFQGDIMSYNYTDLKYIAQSLGYPTDILYDHIHGSVKNNNIIIGFEDDIEVYDSCSFMIKSFSPHYLSNNVRKRLYDADEIIFFGHSLGSSDYHYFNDLFKRQSDVNYANQDLIIRIFTYDEKSRRDILLQLRNMNNKRTNYLYDLCNFDVYRTKDCIDDDKIQLYLTDLSERVNKRFREKTLETVPKTKLLR